MKVYHAYLTSITPYAQGKKHEAPKLERESHDDYEKRTVLEQLHTNMGKILIPPMAFHLCLQETASYLKMQIPGQGKATYTKNFIRGLLFNEPIILDQGPEDCRIERIWTTLTPTNPKSGRGWRYFPVLDHWDACVPFTVIDEILTPAVLKRHWDLAGSITGIGVWRPINRGLWGKFKLLKLEDVTPEDLE